MFNEDYINSNLNYYFHYLVNVITGRVEKSKYYKRAIELDKLYKSLLLINCEGNDFINALPISKPQKKFLGKFKRESDNERFEEVIKQIVPVTKGMCESVFQAFSNTIKAVKPSRKEINFGKKETESNADLEMKIRSCWANYYSNQSLEQYLVNLAPEFSGYKFNDWLITELSENGGKPYPYHVPVCDALDWRYKNGALEYLIVRKDCEHINIKKEREIGSSFSIYLPFYTVELSPVFDESQISEKRLTYSQNQDYLEVLNEMIRVEIGRGEVVNNDSENFNYIVVPNETQVSENTYYINIGKVAAANFDFSNDNRTTPSKKTEWYCLKIYPHLAPVVPATRWGYYRDKTSDGEINTSYLDAGLEVITKAMKDNKTFEESKDNNAYPKEAMYVQECSGPANSEAGICLGKECSACGGTGTIRPRTGSEIIEIPMPPQELIQRNGGLPPLDNLMTTFKTDMETIEFLMSQLDKWEELLHKRIFRSTHFMTSKSKNTATEVEFDERAVYGAINECATHIAEMYEYHAKLIAWYMGADDRTTVVFEFPSDMRALDELQLIALIQKYIDSQVDSYIAREAQLKLIELRFENDEKALRTGKLIAVHNPFFGLSDSVILRKMSSVYVTEKDKVLAENIVRIFDEHPELSNIEDYNTRKDKINEYVEEIIKELEEEKTSNELIFRESLINSQEQGDIEEVQENEDEEETNE